MNYWLNIVFSLSIAIAAVAGRVRYSKIDPAFYPFIWLIWIGLLNELVSLVLVYQHYSNVINYNVYALSEALMITYFFERMNLFGNQKKFYYLIQGFFVVSWLVELLLTPLFSFSSYFLIVHAFVIVLMSISCINRIIFQVPTPLWRHSFFIICIGFVVYFTYSVLVEAFWIFGINHSSVFRNNIYGILSYINLFVNLLFTLAIVWMPTRLVFSASH